MSLRDTLFTHPSAVLLSFYEFISNELFSCASSFFTMRLTDGEFSLTTQMTCSLNTLQSLRISQLGIEQELSPV